MKKYFLIFLSFLLYSVQSVATVTQLGASTATKELTGVMGVLSDTEKIGAATVAISIIPYAFSKLKFALR